MEIDNWSVSDGVAYVASQDNRSVCMSHVTRKIYDLPTPSVVLLPA